MEQIHLSALEPVAANAEAALYDLGDGIACLEFRSKSNSVSKGVSDFIGETLTKHMDGFDGLVIGNQSKNFSVGANLVALKARCEQGDIQGVQQTSMRAQHVFGQIKAYHKPIVAAPYRNTLGGGLELVLHCHKRVAHTQVFMGLVEAGVGLLPAGGGVKETALYALGETDPQKQEKALLIGFDKLICKKKSKDAAEAFQMGYLREGDLVVEELGDLLGQAKAACLDMPQREGYTAQAVKWPGAEQYHKLLQYTEELIQKGMLSSYDKVIGEYIAKILTGGDCEPHIVSEGELLKAESYYFGELARDPRTLERITNLLEHGTLLAN